MASCFFDLAVAAIVCTVPSPVLVLPAVDQDGCLSTNARTVFCCWLLLVVIVVVFGDGGGDAGCASGPDYAAFIHIACPQAKDAVRASEPATQGWGGNARSSAQVGCSRSRLGVQRGAAGTG